MKRPSRTAELAALARASQAREQGVFRGPDDVAVRLLRPSLRFIVGTEPIRRLVLQIMTRRMPGAYGYLLARAKAFDEIVARELEAGATQLVILGAGYDTRVQRFEDLVRGRARAFEVDAPATSARKRSAVQNVFGALPKHVSYVMVDFDRETIDKPLLAAGYDPTARTIFTWEATTFYVTAEAVDQTLGFVARQSARGSAIVFDYLFKAILEGPSDLFGATKTLRGVRRQGEPFTFGIDPATANEFLGARGLTLEENLLPEELERRYIASATDLAHRVGGFYGIASARVGVTGTSRYGK